MFWEVIINEYGLEIEHNSQPTHHSVRNTEEGESTVDQTLSTERIRRWTILNGTHAKCTASAKVQIDYRLRYAQSTAIHSPFIDICA